ncbi:hypothetical protein B4102_3548 [Heyndrickxia sporothermodurans]|uniref:Uncharacterized protein n=1 Tax=Heyndrickxia sporothermodurans TaxID=46224 RepID=A0A150KMT1_9BACI|nr:hypothetical protein B4102_3548 [Heyndrickxia sporothermodurans]
MLYKSYFYFLGERLDIFASGKKVVYLKGCKGEKVIRDNIKELECEIIL